MLDDLSFNVNHQVLSKVVASTSANNKLPKRHLIPFTLVNFPRLWRSDLRDSLKSRENLQSISSRVQRSPSASPSELHSRVADCGSAKS